MIWKRGEWKVFEITNERFYITTGSQCTNILEIFLIKQFRNLVEQGATDLNIPIMTEMNKTILSLFLCFNDILFLQYYIQFHFVFNHTTIILITSMCNPWGGFRQCYKNCMDTYMKTMFPNRARLYCIYNPGQKCRQSDT